MSQIKDLQLSFVDFVTEVAITEYRYSMLKDILSYERDEVILNHGKSFMSLLKRCPDITRADLDGFFDDIPRILDSTSSDELLEICNQKLHLYIAPTFDDAEWSAFKTDVKGHCIRTISTLANRWFNMNGEKKKLTKRPTIDQWNMYIPDKLVTNQAELDHAIATATNEEIMILDHEVGDE